ncbi:MaoC/PaaZ C-terminal domain-containing protein [Thalassotalea agarivorans]|uniref:MaoC like domain-containing protein n=1 Tax=Thalassotalea agarivorans TaxID=349064 RepID=A0A1I0GD64_THASX|nr:MaoC/PaaZ C-terminal domain-containing protein [Thalassotalea agarivorans]SET68088.1 MaoC like domain-containing protein [Thalassotalea agarivorans]
MESLDTTAPSTSEILWSVATRKKYPLDAFEPCTRTFKDIAPDPEKIIAFKKLFNCQEVLPTYMFLIAYPYVGLTFSQSKNPSSLLGLIHIASHFKFIKAHDWTQKTDIQVTMENYVKSDKGIVYQLKTSMIQDGEVTLENVNHILDKNKQYKSAKTANANSKEANVDDVMATHKVEQSIAWQYAKVSGDYNLIHLHAIFAKMFGLKTSLMHGMYNVHWMLANMDQSQLENAGELKVSFNRPCFLPNGVALAQESPRKLSLYSSDFKDRFLVCLVKQKRAA